MDNGLLQKPFSRDAYLELISTLFPSQFKEDVNKVVLPSAVTVVETAQFLGKCELEDEPVYVFEVEHNASESARISISSDVFKIMREHDSIRALVAFKAKKSEQWRLSLMTIDYHLDEKGKVTSDISNPRRYSFLLGPGTKVHTPAKQLAKSVTGFEDLLARFSLEVVNKDFYNDVAIKFTELIGGTRVIKNKTREFPGLLVTPSGTTKEIQQEFAVRLIGRLVFCWFLKQSKSSAGIPLMPEELLSLNSSKSCKNYYENIIEPVFFETLNKDKKDRDNKYKSGAYEMVPYLNGGLFDAHDRDFYKQDKVVPDEWLSGLFEIFETYNFTIDENTISDIELSVDPEMLGRIFENLLAEINPETGKSARKSTGSFYTPREIVNYMVDESITESLANTTGIERSKIAALVSYDLSDDRDHPLSSQDRRKIVEHVGKLRILDPACGSAAFPIGILQKLTMILQRVDPDAKIWEELQLKSIPDASLRKAISSRMKREDYDWVRKLGLIRDVIYGVDIQPIATEVAKLRCYLTLIVEEKIDDSAPNRGVEPLPNLDFKFVSANSLIQLEEVSQLGVFQDNDTSERLRELRIAYFNATNKKEKQACRNDYQVVVEDGELYVDERIGQLKSFHPFETNRVAQFFDPEYMFGESKGFDIVIGNPPYIGEKGNKTLFDSIKKTPLGRKFYLGKMDLFYFFFHLGVDMLKEGGVLSYISTNYFVTATGAKKLIDDFQERTTILKFINFNELKVFESALGQHNMITLLQKGKFEKTASTVMTKRSGFPKNSADVLRSILGGEDPETAYYALAQDDLFDKGYIRLSNSEGSPVDAVLDKMLVNSDSLGDLCEINTGIQTGADKVSQRHIDKFGVSAQKGDGIFVFDRGGLKELGLSKGFIKPWFKNSDVQKYSTSLDHKYELALTNFMKDETQFPAYFTYLNKFKMVLQSRSQMEHCLDWFDLHQIRMKDKNKTGEIKKMVFDKEKIVAPQRSSTNTFGYNDIPWYASADVYFITPKSNELSLKTLLGLLNSKLYFAWLYNRGKRKGEMLELYQEPLTKIPIPNRNSQNVQLFDEIEKYVEIILAKLADNPDGDISTQQTKIDSLVYELFDLSADDIELVEAIS